MEGVKVPPTKRFVDPCKFLRSIKSAEPGGAYFVSLIILALSPDINREALSLKEWVLFYCFLEMILELRF